MDKLITIQKRDEATEEWHTFKNVLARINSSKAAESFANASDRSALTMNFDVRYLPDLDEIRFRTGEFRLIYRNKPFNIVAVDDFFESHQNIRFTAVSYGEDV